MVVRWRFSARPLVEPFGTFSEVFDLRIAEADEFFSAVQPPGLTADEQLVHRQACAGLLWSKQFYHYSVELWLDGDPAGPVPPAERKCAGIRRGGTATTSTCSPFRTSGSTPGSPRGTQLSIASPSPGSIPSGPSGSSSCCCANGTCTRAGSYLPTNGISLTSTHRFTPTPPAASTKLPATSKAAPTPTSSKRSSTSCY